MPPQTRTTAATAYLFEELEAAVGRNDAACWRRISVQWLKLNTSTRARRSAATDPESLPSRHHRAAAPSVRRPAHAAQAPTEFVLASEEARERVKRWHSQLRSWADGVQLQAQDSCQEAKAEVPREDTVKPTNGARQHQWTLCGALHSLKMDEAVSDGASMRSRC